MATNLNGVNLTETFSSSGPDPNAPYTNALGVPWLTLQTTDASVDVTEGVNAINGAIALAIAGPGTVTLNGANTYVLATHLVGGTLQLGAANALSALPVTFVGPATLEATTNLAVNNAIAVDLDVSATIGAASGKTLVLSAGGGLTLAGGDTLRFGSATATGTVDLVPTGAVPALGANAIEVDGGTLQVSDAAASTLIANMQNGLTVGTGAASATLDLDGHGVSAWNFSGNADGVVTNTNGAATLLQTWNTADSTFAGVIEDGAGQVVLSVNGPGGHTFTLTGNNTYTGGTGIWANNTLQLGDGGTSGSVAGPIVANGTLVIDRSDALTLNGAISGGGAIVQNGSGTVTLTGANGGFSGLAWINGGTLTLGSANALGTGSVAFGGVGTILEATANVTLTGGLGVQAGRSPTLGATSGVTLTIAASGIGLVGDGHTLHFGSATDSGTVDLAPAGAIPGGAQNAMAVDGGTLKVGNAAAANMIANMQAGVTVGTGSSDAALNLAGNSVAVTNLGGSANGLITDSVAGAVALENWTTANTTFAGVIQDGHGQVSLDVAGPGLGGGALTLTGANTYTGNTQISLGETLQLGDGGTSGSISGSVALFGKLVLDRSDNFTLGGAIGGAGAIRQNGSGTATLTGANGLYSGTATINAGALALGSVNALGTGNVVFDGTSGMLKASTNATFAGSVTVNQNKAGGFAAAAGNTLTLSGGFTVSGGSLTSQTLTIGSATDTGVVDLAPSAYTGPVFNAQHDAMVLAGGTLVVGSDAAANMLEDLVGLTVGTGAADATLDLHGGGVALENLAGASDGTILSSVSGLAAVIVGSMQSSTFAGKIEDGAGKVALIVDSLNPNKLTLTGANTNTGGVEIVLGTLQIGAGGTKGSIVGPVSDGGTLAFDRSDAVTFSGAITDLTLMGPPVQTLSGSVSMIGTGTLTLSGANTFTGGVKLASGTLDLASASAAGTGPISFAGPAAELKIEHGDTPGQSILGLAPGDALDLVGVTANSAAINGVNQLQAQENGSTVASLQLAASESGLQFSTLAKAGGTLVFVDATVAQYKAAVAAFDAAPDGFAIRDKAAAVAGALASLSAHAAHVASISFADATPPRLKLSAAQAKTDAAALKKIAGAWILDVNAANGAWTTTGHGDKLTIAAIAGKDAITGGGSSETFVLRKGFKQATLVDFRKHLTGSTHDVVSLQKGDFANFAALLADTKASGANLVATAADGDRVTFDGMTKAMLSAAKGDFKFV